MTNRQKDQQSSISELSDPKAKINRARLLNRVVSFYHKTFTEDLRAMEYLKSRGITENTVFQDFTVGFSNGTLLNIIPNEGDIHEALTQIGILTETGQELFYGCVVFPIFDENKNIVDLYGCKFFDGKQTDHYLSGKRQGVFNFQAAKRSKSILLTGSILDAITLYNAGFRDVVPSYGADGLGEDLLDLLIKCQVKETYICFARDSVAKVNAENIAAQLKENGIEPYAVQIPESVQSANDKVDINTFFLVTPDGTSIFDKLLKDANSRTSIRSSRAWKNEHHEYEQTANGFIARYGDRVYELRGIVKEGVKLKATIKAVAQKTKDKAERFHLDTVDLYSNRSRLFFAKACAVLFSTKQEITMDDITRFIEGAESWQPEDQAKGEAPKMTKTEEDEALACLKDPELFSRILSDLETVGITGEDANKLMGYISATSRMLEEPLAVLIQSRSAAGKSTLQDAILSLIPPEAFIKYTRLTGQALFYKEEDSLVHKLIAIEEEHGARDASYSIRNIQSSKYLSIATTGRDSATGKLRTQEYKVKGPVSLMITTTEVELDYETSNRFIILTVDESEKMTGRILQKQRESETLDGLIRKSEAEHITKRHHNCQRLLRPLQVINPFASCLTYPSESLRARRDHKKYLGLIKAIAFLHQYQREIKTVDRGGQAISYIEVTLSDIEKANSLAAEILGRTLDELSPPSRFLLSMIREMVETECSRQNIEPRSYCFTRKDIRTWSKWSDFQIKCHIRQLEDLEYIYSVSGKKGREYVYELLYSGGGEDGKPFLIGLASVDELKRKVGRSSKSAIHNPKSAIG